MIPLKYKDRRDEGETTLRQCQLVQLHMLHVLDAICKKHNIEYFLEGGTLLGAMWRGGFIPWDDDLDVGMFRDQYEKFLRIAREELPKDVILQTPDDVPEQVLAFAKLRDAYSFYAECSMSQNLSRSNGIFLDIFAYDKIPSLWIFERPLVKLCKRCWIFVRALRCSGGRGWWFALFGGWLALPLYAAHYVIRWLFSVLLHVLPCRNYYVNLEMNCFIRRTYGMMYPVGVHQFEDGEFPVPHDWDGLLSEHYRPEWRQPPPKEKQVGGHSSLSLPFQTPMYKGAMKWTPEKDK